MQRATQRFIRALSLRCPNCGSAKIFRSWFEQPERCPGCGLPFEREEGYFLGGMTINLVVAESIPIIGVVLTWLLTRPNSPLLAMEIGGLLGALVLPLLFFPFSRTLWLALDLSFRPPEPRELTDGALEAPARR